jgi:hypothetical protein
VRPALLAVALFAGVVAPPAAAQDLADARRMAQQGQVDSARAALARLLAATPPADTLYPEILYAQGGLAANTTEMQRAYQRLALEFPNSPWADDALLRLAQIEFAVNDPQGALRQVERLRGDYPASPLLGIAALWGARAHFALDNVAAGCVLLADGLARAGDDVELRNQLEYHRGRCGADGATERRSDGAAVQAAEPRDSAPPVAPSPRRPAGWTVQLAALGSRVTADELVAAVQRAGYEAAIVREGGLHKVRAGPWAERADAARALETLRARFGGQPFLVRP